MLVVILQFYYLIIQVSYASSSSELDDQDRFPNFFRIVPPAEYPAVFNAILQQYGWKKVAILTQNEGLFIAVKRSWYCVVQIKTFLQSFERLKKILVAQNVTVMNRVIRSELPVQGLNTNFFVSFL